jgi:hypothetical protein
MAKRKKYKKRSKYPEPFNTLIDIAAGLTMNAIANKAEKKYHYSKKGRINPYRISAFKLGTGGFKSTEDIVRTGAFLGAIGSFDVEADTPYKKINVTSEDPIFNQIKYTSTNNNKYAWRLNCEDGLEWGVSPYDYETRDEYNHALNNAKGGNLEKEVKVVESELKQTENPLKNSPFLCCRVSRLDNGANEYYLTDDTAIKVGDTIAVSTDVGISEGIVIGVKRLSEMNPDELPDESMWILTQEDE